MSLSSPRSTRTPDTWLVPTARRTAGAAERAARRGDTTLARRVVDAIVCRDDRDWTHVPITDHTDAAGRDLFVSACLRSGSRPRAAELARRFVSDATYCDTARLSSRSDGMTPLTAALRGGDAGLACALLASGARAGDADDDGCTALHLVARFPGGDDVARVVEGLIAGGASVAAVDVAGRTALDVASRSGRRGLLDFARAVTRAGGSAAHVDARGRTPLHWALHSYLMELFTLDRRLQEAHTRWLGLPEDVDDDDDNDDEAEAAWRGIAVDAQSAAGSDDDEGNADGRAAPPARRTGEARPDNGRGSSDGCEGPLAEEAATVADAALADAASVTSVAVVGRAAPAVVDAECGAGGGSASQRRRAPLCPLARVAAIPIRTRTRGPVL